MKLRKVYGTPDRYFVDGREVTAKEWEEATAALQRLPGGTPGDSLCGWKPLASDALAVHCTQVQEAQEDAQKKGVPTEFTKDGRPIFRSRQHRKDYMQRYGFFDKGAGYSDAQDGSFRGDRPDQPNHGKLY